MRSADDRPVRGTWRSLALRQEFSRLRDVGLADVAPGRLFVPAAVETFRSLPPKPTGSGSLDEWYITLKLPQRIRRNHPHLPEEVTARVLRYQIPGFRPSLLITSLLETDTYGYASLVSLYHERWRQETMHREWKYSLSMSEFRSHTIRGIFKEVYVQLTLNNVLHCKGVGCCFLAEIVRRRVWTGRRGAVLGRRS